jgi:hypothetical protein
MKMYLQSGYLNIPDIMKDDRYHFIFGVGARGIGKTWGMLNFLSRQDRKFILLRLTQTEVDTISTPESNPFKPLDKDISERIKLKKIDKYITGIYRDGDLIGLVMALTTFAKVRGADFSDYDYIFLDEFIPEKHIKKISKLGEALKNCYETVNRNRELDGFPPVKLVCMANAMNFSNDILVEFNLSAIINKMSKSNQQFYFDVNRGLMLIYPQNSPISQRKAETALYRLKGSYGDMALNNEFREYYDGNVRPQNLKGYRPRFIFDNLCFYRSINATRTYYVSSTCKGQFDETYQYTDYEQMVFIQKHMILHDLYLQGKVWFETAELELRFLEIMKMN